jgi:xanthine dehydrogenase accessory factor
VVWARHPVSARPGDKAVVTRDGRLRGWVGGSCAEPVVIREAQRALAEGSPRLLRLGPPGELSASAEEGVVTAVVSCASEGSLQVFLEPVEPPTHLVVIGRSPLADALVGMASVLGFDTVQVEREGLGASGAATVLTELDLAKAGVGPASFVVVATMGRYDEDALEAALATDAPYVGLVASARRGATVLDALRAEGVAEERLARVKSPAGLPLGRLPHAETAVAILAEIVQLRYYAHVPPTGGDGAETSEQVSAVDPVCGMTVQVVATTPRVDHDGTTYYFCCAGCRRRFEKDPFAFLVDV